MAVCRKLFGILLIIASALSISSGVIAEAQNKEEAPIPELPKEEPESLKPAITENTKQNVVVNFDVSKENYGFFTDNSYTRGPSRYLNALDLAGYLRVRFNYFRDGHLRTYIPGYGGTSMMPPSLSMLNATSSDTESREAQESNPAQNNFSANMRLRLDPTINVTEVVRIKSTIDIFDNLVLGSTPNYLSQGVPSPSWPSSLMSMSQNSPMAGINSWQGSINVKRAYGEATFPIGELKFGRMPFHWGLGILYNSGDGIDNDYGDQIDGISFTTRVMDHFISPGYSIAYTGPTARGGGYFPEAQNFQSIYLPSEAGQRYPLESGDMTHVFSLSFLKRESDFMINRKREEGRANFDYGVFTSYRRQFLDSQTYAVYDINLEKMKKMVVKRESHVGLLSLWSAFSWGTFHIETEAAGIWGKYQIGERDSDLMAQNDDGKNSGKRDIWLLQGGIALRSKYGFLNDRLQLGLDSGWASSQSGPGFGMREGSKKNPETGDPDGRKLPSESGYKTNFKFNPAYTVDLLMYREVLGGISGTVYVKPHLAYFFSRNFGLRGDVITSLAPDKSNTTGNSNWLGVEFDASSFLRTENGFYFQLSYGVLFPLKGLNHQKTDRIEQQKMNVFGEAKVAQTVQAFLGIVF